MRVRQNRASTAFAIDAGAAVALSGGHLVFGEATVGVVRYGKTASNA